MNQGLTVTCISRDKNHSTRVSFNKFGDRYWTDCVSNKSKPGYYFAFYDKKDKKDKKDEVYIHQIHTILSPAEQPADMDWTPIEPNKKNILCFGKRLMTIPWEEWKTGIGKGAPYAVDKYGINQTTTCQGFDCTRFIIPNNKSCAESAVEEDDEEALIVAEMTKRLKEAKAKKQLKHVEALIAQQVDSLNRDIQTEIDQIEIHRNKILELDTKIEAVKRGDYNAELIRQATLTPK